MPNPVFIGLKKLTNSTVNLLMGRTIFSMLTILNLQMLIPVKGVFLAMEIIHPFLAINKT